MATLTLQLEDDAFRELTEAARRAGVTPERMAEMLVGQWIIAHDDLRAPPGVGEPARAWAGAKNEEDGFGQLTAPEDYEGPFVDLDEALDGFSAELNRKRKSSAG